MQNLRLLLSQVRPYVEKSTTEGAPGEKNHLLQEIDRALSEMPAVQSFREAMVRKGE